MNKLKKLDVYRLDLKNKIPLGGFWLGFQLGFGVCLIVVNITLWWFT